MILHTSVNSSLLSVTPNARHCQLVQLVPWVQRTSGPRPIQSRLTPVLWFMRGRITWGINTSPSFEYRRPGISSLLFVRCIYLGRNVVVILGGNTVRGSPHTVSRGLINNPSDRQGLHGRHRHNINSSSTLRSDFAETIPCIRMVYLQWFSVDLP